MSRRNAIRIVSLSLAVALFCGIWAFKTHKENKSYIRQMENGYSYMLSSLSTATDNIAELLNKGRFVTTAEGMGEIASKLLTEAEISKNSLSQLPDMEELASLNKFYSQVGNYALTLSNNLKNRELSMEETANTELLSDIANRVAGAVNEAAENFGNSEYFLKELGQKVENATDEKTLYGTLGALEGELTDYPTLIYDGPYSDHLLTKEAEMLKNAAVTGKEEALKTAARWSKSSLPNLEFAGETAGKIETYDFLGEGITVSITKKGGYVLYFRKENEVKDIILSNEQARLKANAYLNDMGLSGMQETYYFEADGVCTVNFAFLDGKTLCYTDLIKVGVAMDTGDIVFYEAGGYITNHRERAFPTAKYTEEQARELISPKLTVRNTRLALIPTNAVEETRCYEFTCVSGDKQDILVYINTADLSEEEILILKISDGGVLVK